MKCASISSQIRGLIYLIFGRSFLEQTRRHIRSVVLSCSNPQEAYNFRREILPRISAIQQENEKGKTLRAKISILACFTRLQKCGQNWMPALFLSHARSCFPPLLERASFYWGGMRSARILGGIRERSRHFESECASIWLISKFAARLKHEKEDGKH